MELKYWNVLKTTWGHTTIFSSWIASGYLGLISLLTALILLENGIVSFNEVVNGIIYIACGIILMNYIVYKLLKHFDKNRTSGNYI